MNRFAVFLLPCLFSLFGDAQPQTVSRLHGKWILDNIIGVPPLICAPIWYQLFERSEAEASRKLKLAPQITRAWCGSTGIPAGVLLRDNVTGKNLPVPQRLAEQRANPAGSGYNKLMDPPGFALENFAEDGVPIDASKQGTPYET